MGGGTYNFTSRNIRATSAGYATKSADQIFRTSNQGIHEEMSPKKLKFREARDSDDHPTSIPIIIGLDETGSMGMVPHELVKEGLPKLMKGVLDNGVHDASVLFLGIGDHYSDTYPLQVGQFEASDELLDKWLTNVCLEGNGGGQNMESYHLAWFFAAKLTKTDHWEKRGEKGFLFTIGDEWVHNKLTASDQKKLLGTDFPGEDTTAQKLLKEASERYHVYHIHTRETFNGGDSQTQGKWKDLLGDNFIVVDRHEEIPTLIARVIAENVTGQIDREKKPVTEEKKPEPTKEGKPSESTAEEIL